MNPRTRSFILGASMLCLVAPVGAFGQEIRVNLADLTSNTCGSPAPRALPAFFGPFAAATTRWFDSASFSLGAQSEITLGSTSASATLGKITLMPIVITKSVDGCSAGLFQAAATQFPSGGSGTSGAIYVTRSTADGEPQPQLLIRFELAFVQSSEISVDAGNTLQERVTLQVGRISYTYSPIDSAGRTLPPVCFGWDITRNVQWAEGCR